MSRLHADPIEVRCAPVESMAVQHGPGSPEQFLWRGRLYRVRSVLAAWVEVGAWWESPVLDLTRTEREVWRVEASAGRSANSGVYDLSVQRSTNRWELARTLD